MEKITVKYLYYSTANVFYLQFQLKKWNLARIALFKSNIFIYCTKKNLQKVPDLAV